MKNIYVVFFALVLFSSFSHQQKKRIVFFGDSITQAGVQPNGYITKLSQILDEKKIGSSYELDMVYVSNMSADKLAKYIEAYNRLRNAVYVTYPYARTAGNTLNDVNAHLTNLSKGERKKYIKSREKRIKRSVRRSVIESFCLPGKGLNEINQPPDRK